METWAWLLAYVLGFGLLQVALYRYLSNDRGTPDRASSGATERAGRAHEESGQSPAGDRVRCQHCGATNASQPTIRYCRECTNPIQ